jgi:hypothetical protein
MTRVRRTDTHTRYAVLRTPHATNRPSHRAWRPPAPRGSARCWLGARRNAYAALHPPPLPPPPPPSPASHASPPLLPPHPPPARTTTTTSSQARRGPWRARPRGAAGARRARRGTTRSGPRSGRTARTTGTSPRYVQYSTCSSHARSRRVAVAEPRALTDSDRASALFSRSATAGTAAGSRCGTSSGGSAP